ncbi:Ankyrin repeat domain-containing protein 50-like protein 1 [Paraphaeosphaeria minitans]|uniref:Ankyrin repeat domain-containing protein 50-like protein 1 n=1 Tax=Paraphaeosphaeria minitans TaxID=565426 RepID=A0A9P6G8L0_9PLEO|nr:Ankyrin repeat domain-containing protein 50-like protein 1 [Paraphaeosphaeria minitans]
MLRYFPGTALQRASENGRVRVVKILLEAGARVNAPGGRCGSALERALRSRHSHVEQLLRSDGASG